MRNSYLGVDKGDADPVIVKQHAALGTILVQLLKKTGDGEVRGDKGDEEESRRYHIKMTWSRLEPQALRSSG